MAKTSDILAAEQAQGEKLTVLIALTDAIFAKLSESPSEDPVVQEVLDMIAQHNTAMDEATARDTPPAA